MSSSGRRETGATGIEHSINGVTASRLPAEEGAWVFIIGDMILFTIFFNVFVFYERSQPAIFLHGQQTLQVGLGLLNTVLLLTSSWMVVLGLRAVRCGDVVPARRHFLAAMLLGLCFAGVKMIEYGSKIAHGLGPTTDIFYTLYFVFTGIHLVHVLLGVILLGVVRRLAGNSGTASHRIWIEIGAIFWHMVDLLWIILFPLIYLVRP